MKSYGTYRGGNPGQVVLSTRLGTLGTYTHPFKGAIPGDGKAVMKKDEVAVYLSHEKVSEGEAQIRFSRDDLREWCQKVLTMLEEGAR